MEGWGASGGTPSLSVVVIGRNEGERLRRCLESVHAMDWPAGDAELIYVDSGSRDNSLHLAEQSGARIIALNPRRPTAALARNAGWRAARAPFVLFIDGDSVIAPGFAIEAQAQFDDPKVAAVCGRTRELAPSASIYHRVFDLQWYSPPPGPVEFCIGTALMRRSAVESVDGFDSDLMAGEEPDFCARLRSRGFLVVGLDIPMLFHDLSMTRFSQYWWRLTRKGYADAEVSLRYQSAELPHYTWFTWRSRLVAPAVVLAPVLRAVWCTVTGSVIPVAVAIAGLSLGVANSAWKCRRKALDWRQSVLFGVHSLIREIPLLYGQLRYLIDRCRGRKCLIEYKSQVSAASEAAGAGD